MKILLTVLFALIGLRSSFSQLQFAGTTPTSNFSVNTNNHHGNLHSFPLSTEPFFQSMKQGNDGKIYFVSGFNTVGSIETNGLNRTSLAILPSNVQSDICLGNDGNIYVTTASNKLYRVNADGSGYVDLGTVPASNNLLSASDGWLFGISSGSPNIIFKVRTDGSNYTILRTCVAATDGSGVGKLSMAPNNRLYGTFDNGGPFFRGTVVRIDTSGNNFSVLLAFPDPFDGTTPRGVPAYQNGKLFVTTLGGGLYGRGAAYSIDTPGSTITRIYDFSQFVFPFTGESPSGLTPAGSGKLVGGTFNNSGKIFSLSEDGSTISIIHTPASSSLYFTTSTVFPPIVLNDGVTVVFQSNQNGLYSGGYLYSTSINGTGPQVVANHGNNPGGQTPVQGLIKNGSNVLFGVTATGGTGGGGTVYRQNADGSGFFIIHHFSGVQARVPSGKLLLATDGMLYGVCQTGGNPTNIYNGGAIYRLNIDGSSYQVIKEFTNAGQIYQPIGALTEGPGGELYGITQSTYASGTRTAIYRINKDGTGFVVLRIFDQATEGFNATEQLVYNSGFLYGTCIDGGTNNTGTAFRLAVPSNNLQILKQFSSFGPDGSYPLSGIMLAANGRLYGTTSAAGTLGAGTIYSMNTDGTSFTNHYNFDFASSGFFSQSKLVQASDGLLYGTTSLGSVSNNGVFFRFNQNTNSFSIIRTFDPGESGSVGELVEIPFSATLPLTLKSFDVEKINTGRARLYWTTEKEFNFEKFVVERSSNGRDFMELATVNPKPTTGLSSKYEWIDPNPGKSKVYYRLKMVDNNNSFTYSKIRSLDFSTNAIKLAIYPNPAKELITLDNEFKGALVSISIVDNMGRLVYNKSVSRSTTISIDISHLSKGTYHLTATDGIDKHQSVFIKE